MEDNQQSSMTDRDRKMHENFEIFNDSDDTQEKRKKKSLPKRSLFFGETKAPEPPATKEASTNAEWLNRQNSRAEWRQGLLKSLMIENTEAARRVQEENKGDKEERAQVVPDSKVDTKLIEVAEVATEAKLEKNDQDEAGLNSDKQSDPIKLDNPNIIAAATSNTDPGLAKMNEYYLRRKNTGKVILTGLVGYAVHRNRNDAQKLSVDREKSANDKKSATKTVEIKAASLDVRTMTMPELLQLAEHIDAGAGSLKDMYLQGRIDAVNLRKIVAEYEAGHDFKTLLKRSLLAEEMKHELRNEIKTDNTQTSATIKPSKKNTQEPTVEDEVKQESKSDLPEEVSVAEKLVEDTKKADLEVSDDEPAPPNEPPIFVKNESKSVIQSNMQIPSYEPVLRAESPVEYIRVPTYLAIVIGVTTGGVLAAVLLLLVF